MELTTQNIISAFDVMSEIVKEIKSGNAESIIIEDFPHSESYRVDATCMREYMSYLSKIATCYIEKNSDNSDKEVVYCELFSKEFYEYQKEGYTFNQKLSENANGIFNKIAIMERRLK